MPKQTRAQAYPATFAVKVKIAKEANLDARQAAALKAYAEEILEGLAVDMVNGNGDGKVSFSKTAVVVKDFSIFDLTPEKHPQTELPGQSTEE